MTANAILCEAPHSLTGSAIDVLDLIPLAGLPKFLPHRGGKPAHVSKGFRWAAKGVRGIRLRTIRAGGTLCTCRAWLLEFFQALTAIDTNPAPARRSVLAWGLIDQMGKLCAWSESHRSFIRPDRGERLVRVRLTEVV